MRSYVLLCVVSMTACTTRQAQQNFTTMVIVPALVAAGGALSNIGPTREDRVAKLVEQSREELERQYAQGPRCWVETERIDERTWYLRSCRERLVCEPESNTYRCEDAG